MGPRPRSGVRSSLRLLAVHAHADDESITMGGVLAICADRGVKTAVVCCTDGKAATIFCPDMPEATTRHRLADIRVEELRAACSILGVGEVHHLGYGDSGMPGDAANDDPGAFWRAGLHEVVSGLVTHIRRFRPHVVVTYDANGAYGHPDHIQAHRATLLAVEAAYTPLYPDAGAPWQVAKLYYTAFPIEEAVRAVATSEAAGLPSPFGDTAPDELPFVTPAALVTTAVDCSAGVIRKREAMRAHRSQIQPHWPLVWMPEDLAVGAFGIEHFQLVISRVPTRLPESDLFAGVLPTD